MSSSLGVTRQLLLSYFALVKEDVDPPALGSPDGSEYADPFAFVREIADSDAVVTDSFHGLQFATIFRRPFAALGDVHDPMSNASRLVDFCRRCGLGGRVQDIGSFRNGETPSVDVGELDAQALEADRVRSLGELRALLPSPP